MFNRKSDLVSPLHKAVIEENTNEVERLKDSEWRYMLDRNGFNPLEIAQLLGQRYYQELLSKASPLTLNIHLKNREAPCVLTLSEFEKMFKVIYRSFLTFPSYQTLEEVIRLCPYLLRFEWLISSGDTWEAAYQAQLSGGVTAETIIKWINPVLGYGLFAAADLLERSFVAEYTGMIRQIDKKNPDLNEYCFQYPTKLGSSKYFVIDALDEGNITRFINHSDQPNLQPLWIVNRGVLHLIFIANRFIPKGTELTFDYGPDYWVRRERKLLL